MTSHRFKVFTLHVKGLNIDNVALEDIAGYLEDLALLLGKDSSPRYHSIKRGSLTLAAKVPAESEVDVRNRGFQLRTGDAPEDAVRARERLSRRLGVHRAKEATLFDSTRAKVIEIPIQVIDEEMDIPSLPRTGTLQGKVIRLGGKLEKVSVDIQDVDDHVYSCKATRNIAKKLAHEMFDRTIRVHGTGRWHRGEEGWHVEGFQIHEFEILEDDSLVDVVKDLREVPSPWDSVDDSLHELESIRNGEAE